MKKINLLSVLVFFAAVISLGLAYLITHNFSNTIIYWYWVFLSWVAIIFPPVTKHDRLTNGKKGMILELLTIAAGGLNFYFLAQECYPKFSWIGGFGGIICLLIYCLVKVKKTDGDTPVEEAAEEAISEAESGEMAKDSEE